MKYLLQIVHNTDRPDHGKGHNVIETMYDQRYQADAALRRHNKQPHEAVCEATIMEAPDGYSISDDGQGAVGQAD